MKTFIINLILLFSSILCYSNSIVVTNTYNSGVGSLRHAIASANNLDTIKFNTNLLQNGSDSIVLDSAITFNKSLTIKGLYNIMDTLYISGGRNDRIFKIENTEKITLDSLVLINGVLNTGTNNANGGALYVYDCDSLFIENSVLKNNSINSPYGTARGGALFYSASQISNLNRPLLLYIKNCSISNNQVNSSNSSGGGIFYRPISYLSNFVISNSSVINNTIDGFCYGAGISIIGSKCDISNSTFAFNNASGGYARGGAIYIQSIYNTTTAHYLKNLTIIHNSVSGYNSSAGGAAYFDNSNSISNIFNIINSTIINNSQFAQPYDYYGRIGGIFNQSSSQIPTLFISSSILANNYPENIHSGDFTTIQSGGYNLFSDLRVLGSISSDRENIDSNTLNLGPLQRNGGTTMTCVPLQNSVAINSGNPNDFSSSQNGEIIDSRRDVGAAEQNASTPCCSDTYLTDNQNVCDSLVWIDGTTYYNNNNSASYILQASNGYDSIIMLNLTLLNYSTEHLTACDSLTWQNGITYYNNENHASYILQSTLGCDSIVSLDLTINNNSYYIDSITSCNSYTWINGETYTANNDTSKYIIENSEGCDSIISLELKLNKSYNTDSITSCESYTWINGETYTSNNDTSKYIIQNHLGCDSVISLNLIINNPSETIKNYTVCDSMEWINNEVYYQSTYNTISYLDTNSKGCDSIIYLNLTIHESPQSTIFDNEGVLETQTGYQYQWFFNGDSINNANTYVYIPTENGLYSVETTNNQGCSTINEIYYNSVNIKKNNTVNINISPNPNNGMFKIKSSKYFQYSILNALGKTIDFSNNYQKYFQVNISENFNGVYYVKTSDINGNLYYTKIIKTK